QREREPVVVPAGGTDLPGEIVLGNHGARPEPGDCRVDTRGHLWRAEHSRAAGAKDARLLGTDQLECVAEPLAVIATHRDEHRHSRGNQVRGIEAPTKADLEHRDVHPGPREDRERRKRVVLEEGEGRSATCRLDLLEDRDELRIGDLGSPDADALVVTYE